MEVSPLPQTADRVSSTSTVGLLSQAPSPSVLGAAFFCTALGAETKPVRRYPILDSSQAHLCDTQIQGTHGTVNQSLGWGCEAFPKSGRQEEPGGAHLDFGFAAFIPGALEAQRLSGSPGFLPMSQQAACSVVIRQLVGSRAISLAPQSSRNVCVHRCLWRCVHVSCFAFPLSSWQALHFQSTHWVNFSRFKAVVGKRPAPGSCCDSGHRTSSIVWLSWHLCKLP